MDDYTANDDVTYVISVVNTGAADLLGLTVSDDLGAYEYNAATLVPLTYVENSMRFYVNGAIQPAPAVTADPTLIINGIDVPAGGNAMLIYEVNVNEYAPISSGSSVVNNISIAGPGVGVAVETSETIPAYNKKAAQTLFELLFNYVFT